MRKWVTFLVLGALLATAIPVEAQRGVRPRIKIETLNWRIRRAAIAFTPGANPAGTDSLQRSFSTASAKDTTAPFFLGKVAHSPGAIGGLGTPQALLRLFLVAENTVSGNDTMTVGVQFSLDGNTWFNAEDITAITQSATGKLVSQAIHFDSDTQSFTVAAQCYLYPWIRFTVRADTASPVFTGARAYVSYIAWEAD